jgi:hypothetical protein
MNYRETSAGVTPTTLLGNAVFLPRFNPVKILAYDEFADPSVRSRVDLTIGWAGADIGQGYRITSINHPDSVNSQLKKPDYDVFLMYEQSLAPTGTLSTYGSKWAQTLESFSYVGGVIVVLSGATGTKEMPEFLTSARLLEVTSETAVSNSFVYNREPGSSLGTGVENQFLAPHDACVFTTPAPSNGSTLFVVTDNAAAASRRPLAVQRLAIAPTTQ